MLRSSQFFTDDFTIFNPEMGMPLMQTTMLLVQGGLYFIGDVKKVEIGGVDWGYVIQKQGLLFFKWWWWCDEEVNIQDKRFRIMFEQSADSNDIIVTLAKT